MSTAFAGAWDTLPIPLTSWILDVIKSMGHSNMTPVQASAIPLFMKHKDVVVEAVTGSGKTLAFVIPILEKLIRRKSKLKNDEVGALVISPTRELATQIHSVFSLFLSSQPRPNQSQGNDEMHVDEQLENPSPLLLVSSTNSSPKQDLQRFQSTGADIIIGTPGRIEEFLLGNGKSIVNVKELEILVLDEADRLLDLGFQEAVTRIISHLPKQRRTGLFSATMTDADALSELVRVGLRNPARIVVKVQSKKMIGVLSTDGRTIRSQIIEERRIPANLKNYFLRCKTSEKLVQLLRIISHEADSSSSSQFIVYFSTCACVDYFYKIISTLLPSSANIFSLHGNLTPSARTRALSNFVTTVSSPTSPSLLLATDVAARGLDLPDVDVVVQFDPPSDPKAFSHRCGRTARAGRSGRAWVLLVGREIEYVDFMNIRKIPLTEKLYLTEDGSNTKEEDTRPEDPQVQTIHDRIRRLLLTDRALYDQSAKAFVSFVRAYSKHEASYIFRVKDLDLVGAAKSFGLLRLPRMPELRNANRDTWNDAEVDWDTLAYADPMQETKRVEALAVSLTTRDADRQRRQAARAAIKHANSAWSIKLSQKEEREKRRGKRIKKRKWLKTQGPIEAPQDAPAVDSLKRRKEEDAESADSADNWGELAREEKMAKKVRKGEVTQRVFDAEFADL